MQQNQIDDGLEIFNVFISLMVYGCFIFSTYHDPACPTQIPTCGGDHITPKLLIYSEIVLMILMAVDFLIFFLISDNRISYVFSFDYGVVFYLPFFTILLMRFDIITDQAIIQKYYINFWKVTRIFSINRLMQVFTRRNKPMERVLFKCVYTGFVIFLMFGSLMITIENAETYNKINETLALEFTQPEHFEVHGQEILDELEGFIYFYHDMLYYVFVTFSTVGYGDIYPQTTVCKILFFVFFALFLITL